MRRVRPAKVARHAGGEVVGEQKIRAQETARFKAMAGALRRAGQHDAGCPKCGAPQLAKKFCYGLEPDLGRVLHGFPNCEVIGPHLHASCVACEFAWMERTRDDDLMIDGRGAIRHDEEQGEDGRLTRRGPRLVEAAPA